MWFRSFVLKAFGSPFFLLVCFCSQSVQAQIFPNLGGQRVGISGLIFLKNDLSPRSIGLGGAHTSLSGDYFAPFTNPALIAENRKAGLGISTLTYGAQLNHSAFSAMLPVGENKTISLSAHGLSSGQMEVRTEFQPMGTGQLFTANNVCLGLGYGQNLSDQFAFGGVLKVIRESLAEYGSTSLAIDLGFLYRTDWKDLRFAAALQHFGTSYTLSGTAKPVTFTRSGAIVLDDYQAPTLFKMSVSFKPYQMGDHSIMTIAQLDHPNDNAENIRIGAEYAYKNLLFARAGYRINVEGQGISGGFGAKMPIGRHWLTLDYSAMPTRFLGLFHSIGLSYSINPLPKEEAPVQN